MKMLKCIKRWAAAVWSGWWAIWGLYPRLPEGVVCGIAASPIRAGQAVCWADEKDSGERISDKLHEVMMELGDMLETTPMPSVQPPKDNTSPVELQPGMYLYAGEKQRSEVRGQRAEDSSPLPAVELGEFEAAVVGARTIVRRQWPNIFKIWQTLGPRVGLLHAALAEEGLTVDQRIAISRRVLHYRRLNREKIKN